MKDIKLIVEMVEEKADSYTEELRRRYDNGLPYGQRRPTSEQVLLFVDQMLQQYPMQWWRNEETGEELWDSAWLATLRDDERVEGGKSTFNRIARAVGRVQEQGEES